MRLTTRRSFRSLCEPAQLAPIRANARTAIERGQQKKKRSDRQAAPLHYFDNADRAYGFLDAT